MGKENAGQEPISVGSCARLLAKGDCRAIFTCVNQRLVCLRPHINVKVERGLTSRLYPISRKFELKARSNSEQVVVEIPKQFHS